jgi:acetaldehyde dehydrogenase (acetylating)
MDRDLASIQEARDAVVRAREAQARFAEFSQAQVDRVVRSVSEGARSAAERLARVAVEETGIGRFEDKVIKNRFAAVDVYEYIKDIKTCGILDGDETAGVWDVAVPVGVICGITPVTNPTSTVIYNALIALKSRNAVVFSPHPAAARCTMETSRAVAGAAERAGAPAGVIECLTIPTLEAAQELMKHDGVDLILATGGSAMVRAAYSSGKPAYGVGPGNVPVYVDRSADVPNAARCIVTGKAFDYGTVCSSEQAVVCDEPVKPGLIEALKREGCHFLSDDEKAGVERTLDAGGYINPDVIGRPATRIAELAGVSVPGDTKVLVGFEDRVGPDAPFSWEKISPVLGFYSANGWRAGCERSIEILENRGLGHTMVIHATDEKVIREFALHKPVSRLIVNTMGTHGAIGLSTDLPPAMTLGCGVMGGNITSDNITPLHLLDVRRVAFGKDIEVTSPPGGSYADSAKTAAEVDEELVERVVAEVLKELKGRKGA